MFGSVTGAMGNLADSAGNLASAITSPAVGAGNDTEEPQSPGTSSILDDISAGASAASSAVAEAGAAAATAADSAVTAAYDNLGKDQQEIVNNVVKTATSTADMAAKFGQDKLDELEKWKAELTEEITAMVEASLMEKLHETFGTVGENLKESITDPDMPEVCPTFRPRRGMLQSDHCLFGCQFVADGQNWVIDRILDEVEYDVTLAILSQLRESE